MEIILALGSAIFGTILSIVLPRTIDWYKNMKTKELYTEWFSEWMTMNDNTCRWTKEKLIIKNGFGNIKFHNKDNVDNYIWSGTLSQTDNRYLYGQWVSKKFGAYSRGTIMLAKSSQGDFLYGHLAGPNDDGTIKIGKIVIALDEEKIEKAKNKFN